MPPAIASAVFNRLVPKYPRMTFALTVGATDVVLRALRKRDVELVISRLADFVEDEDLNVDTLFHDELAVICSKRSKTAQVEACRPYKRAMGVATSNRLPPARHAKGILRRRLGHASCHGHYPVNLRLERVGCERTIPGHPSECHADDAERSPAASSR
jgi:DNA-binding transcriptional LysR family regulator